MRHNKPGILISIDFEMGWGFSDYFNMPIKDHFRALDNVPMIVSNTLKMLLNRNLKATWATVGALSLSSLDDYNRAVLMAPKYRDKRLNIDYCKINEYGKYYFAPQLIDLILNTNDQELASHSFSHIYFKEPGISREDFVEDLKTFIDRWKSKYNLKIDSYVFPRNQIVYTDVLKEFNILRWRTNEKGWYYNCNTKSDSTYLPRLMRLIDSVNMISKRACENRAYNCRSSLFLRFNLPEALWLMHLAKLKKELSNLNNDELYHLWWHPHNLGANPKRSLERLKQVLDIIYECCSYGAESFMMNEV